MLGTFSSGSHCPFSVSMACGHIAPRGATKSWKFVSKKDESAARLRCVRATATGPMERPLLFYDRCMKNVKSRRGMGCVPAKPRVPTFCSNCPRLRKGPERRIGNKTRKAIFMPTTTGGCTYGDGIAGKEGRAQGAHVGHGERVRVGCGF